MNGIVYKLFDNSKDILKATSGSAGYDLTARYMEINYNNYLTIVTYSLGISIEMPDNYVGLLFPRSSVYKTGLTCCNSVGVIDSDYRGEISIKFYAKDLMNIYKVGDRVAQLIIMQKFNFDNDSKEVTTIRGEGGYGSTGR